MYELVTWLHPESLKCEVHSVSLECSRYVAVQYIIKLKYKASAKNSLSEKNAFFFVKVLHCIFRAKCGFSSNKWT